jgi:hypothetical protein
MRPDMPSSMGLGFLGWKTGTNWDPSILPTSFASSCGSTEVRRHARWAGK